MPNDDDKSRPPVTTATDPSPPTRRTTQSLATPKPPPPRPASAPAPAGPVTGPVSARRGAADAARAAKALRKSSPLLHLSPNDFDLMNAARRILEGALSVVPGETVLVLVDRARLELVPPLTEVASLGGAKCEVLVLEDLGRRPFAELPPAVAEKITQAQASIFLAAVVDGEHPMRLALLDRVRDLGLRHAHMLGVTRRTMLAGFSVDPARVLDATRAVRMRLRPSSVLHARSASGTDLVVKLTPSHRWVEHVGVIRPGRWENLPSGEVITSPLTASGVFVCDAACGGHFATSVGLLTRTPIRLEIQDGAVQKVECSDPNLQRGVEAFLALDRLAARVGTVVLGTNVGLLAPIGELVCDQNLPGLHITLGSTFHDVTGAQPTIAAMLPLTSSGGDVDLDGAPLLRAGRYMI